MEFCSLLWNIFAPVITTIIELVANLADEVMFSLDDNEVYSKIARVRNFK